MTVICSPETFAYVMVKGSAKWVTFDPPVGDMGGVPLIADRFCPTWGPKPKWWRRLFLREKTQRVLYVITDLGKKRMDFS